MEAVLVAQSATGTPVGIAIWIRCSLVLASSIILLLIARSRRPRLARLPRCASGSSARSSWPPSSSSSSIPGFLPDWVRIEQAVCGALVLPVAILVNLPAHPLPTSRRTRRVGIWSIRAGGPCSRSRPTWCWRCWPPSRSACGGATGRDSSPSSCSARSTRSWVLVVPRPPLPLVRDRPAVDRRADDRPHRDQPGARAARQLVRVPHDRDLLHRLLARAAGRGSSLAVGATAVVAGLAQASSFGSMRPGSSGRAIVVALNVVVMCGLSWGLRLARTAVGPGRDRGRAVAAGARDPRHARAGLRGDRDPAPGGRARSGRRRRERGTPTPHSTLARDGLAEARRSVQALRPAALDAAGLPEAIATAARRWSERTGIPVDVRTSGDAERSADRGGGRAAAHRAGGARQRRAPRQARTACTLTLRHGRARGAARGARRRPRLRPGTRRRHRQRRTAATA